MPANTGTQPESAAELAAARDGRDLVPGDPRGIAALEAMLTTSATNLGKAMDALAVHLSGLSWEGLAADAMNDHRRCVLNTTDVWQASIQQVLSALGDHQAAVVQAQDTATAAIQQHHAAQHDVDEFAACWGNNPEAQRALNYELLHHQVHNRLTVATSQATDMVTQAHARLDNAGQDVARIVRTATAVLQDTPLPTLHRYNQANTTTAPAVPPLETVLPQAPEATVVVAEPHDGIHDSLSRIAARYLGNANRWPEIYQLNVGRTVGPHAILTNPSLIQPGWTLRLPHPTPPPIHTPPPPTPVTPGHLPPTAMPSTPGLGHTRPPRNPAPPQPLTPIPTTTRPTTPPTPWPAHPNGHTSSDTAVHQPGAAAMSSSGHGVDLGDGLFLAGGVAVALAGIAVVARGRSRVRRGNDFGDDAPPIVRRLAADLTALQAPESAPATAELGQDEWRCINAAGSPAEKGMVPLGQSDGHSIVLNLAATYGVGLRGAGASAVARALLISVLTTDPTATCWLPAPDWSFLFTGQAQATSDNPQSSPPQRRLVIPGSLTDVLDYAEAEIVTRTRLIEECQGQAAPPPLVIVTSPPENPGRLQAVAELGTGLGIALIVLGDWPAGITCTVATDGRISQVDGEQIAGDTVTGLVAFTAPAKDTVDILNLLTNPQAPHSTTISSAHAPVAEHVTTAARAENPATTGQTLQKQRDYTTPTRASRRSDTTAAQAPPNGESDLEILDPRRVQAPDIPPHRSVPYQRQATDPIPNSGISADESTSTRQPAAGSTRPTPSGIGPRLAGAMPALVTISVLGGLRVHWRPESAGTKQRGQEREVTGMLQPRSKELLVLLALHPDGATRDTLVSALWARELPARPTNALHTALSRLRATLAAATAGRVREVVSVSNGRYQLDPEVVDVDYWRFVQALAARRAASTDHDRIEAYRRVIDSYGGPLAEDVRCQWIEPIREAIRRDAIDAVAALARALVEQDPQQTLDLLEIARAFDPHNELLYRDIMRLQERLGQLDAIPRTLTLLTTRLAELDTEPTPQAHALAARLGHRHDDNPADIASSPAGGGHGRSALG